MADPADGPLQAAAPDDVDELASLWAGAFPSRGVLERTRELREGLTYGTLADCWVVRDGRSRLVAGALRTYRLSLHARGRVWPTMGLAAVAVAPDHRRRGLGRRMCVHALQIARERGCVLSALYPFRTSFYTGLGYAMVGTLLRHRFAPADLALYPGWDRVTRARGPGDVRAIYEQAARASTGLIDRPDAAWRFLTDARVTAYVHYDPDGRPSGYVVARVQRARLAERMRIVELVALDGSAYEALLGWIAAQRDQFTEVVYDALPGERFDRRLRNARRVGSGRPRGLWMDTAALLRGPMLRLLNPGVVQSDDDAAGFALVDEDLPENTGFWVGGRRQEDDVGGDGCPALGPGDAAERFLMGTLPGQLSPPERWHPIPFGEEFRLLDEF